MHAPRDPDDVERGRGRIVFEEFFGIALAAALKRARREAAGGATPIEPPADWYARFVAELPFAPTGAQTRVIEQIARDMRRTAPMNRLLQGDVGSGKTLVAAAAIVPRAPRRHAERIDGADRDPRGAARAETRAAVAAVRHRG